MNPQRKTVAMFLAGALALAVACGKAAVSNPPASGNGQLQVTLTEAPNPVVDQIWVNVTSVRAHSETAGWVTVTKFKDPLAVDLLKLQGATQDLGLVDLPPGKITQIRLLLAADGNHVVKGTDTFPLKVPSGCQSGIKIIGPWEVAACQRASVTLDFDGKKSIWTHPTGQGDEWILRPVIRTKKSATDDVGCTDGGSGETPPPPPAGVGAPCTASPECMSGVCDATTFTCSAGPAGAPCKVGADCASASCGTDGNCVPAPTTGGAGSGCTVDGDCLSNSCGSETKTCDPGVQGTPCKVNADCQAPLSCISTTEGGVVTSSCGEVVVAQ